MGPAPTGACREDHPLARIFLSTAGEGRGHATRTRALAEQLRGRHDLSIFAPAHAYELLAPIYAGTDVRVERIPGISSGYRGRRFSIGGTIGNVARYLLGARSLLGHLQREIRAGRPDLVVTDFEPALPRAAARCGVPYMSVDHQHFALVSDLSSLPRELRRKLWIIESVARAVCPDPVHRVVSSFYFPPLKPEYRDVTQVGVLLRPEVKEAARSDGSHLVAYLRRFAPPRLVDALGRLGREVRVYGLGAQRSRGDVRFRPLDPRTFVEDLASSHALVCTAGNQIVGEALYLGKSVLAMPEAENFEQYINAHFLEQAGVGEWVPLEDCSEEHLRAFCGRAQAYRARIQPARIDGTRAAVEAVQRQLGETRRVPELRRAAAELTVR